MDIEESSQSSETDESGTPYQLSPELWMVPCVVDPRANCFTPTVRPTSEHLSEKFHLRQQWLPIEDEILRRVIAAKGTKAWTAIAHELNLQVHQGQGVRHGKQCRERWYNHLDPYLRKGNWSCAEDLTVLEKQLEFGNRWSEIAKLLPGRNENSVKNRWKSLIRKASKELPEGTDLVNWLIAERRSHSSPGSDMPMMSPLMCSGSPLPQFQVNLLPSPLPGMSPVAFHMMAVESVKRGLRNMEQVQMQPFTWTPYNVQDTGDSTANSSPFLSS